MYLKSLLSKFSLASLVFRTCGLCCSLCSQLSLSRFASQRQECDHAVAMRKSYKDKHVLLTGGSEGIGLALAHCFMRDGAAVTILSRTLSKLQIAATELQVHPVLAFTCMRVAFLVTWFSEHDAAKGEIRKDVLVAEEESKHGLCTHISSGCRRRKRARLGS